MFEWNEGDMKWLSLPSFHENGEKIHTKKLIIKLLYFEVCSIK